MTTPSEFEGLATESRDHVYRQMLRLCGNREDAEDVLTDALLAAYRGMDTLRERAAFGAWLAQIARRLCFHLRSQQRIHEALSLDQLQAEGFEPERADAESPEDQLLANEMRAAVRSAIDALPADLRDVYTLRDLDEQSGDEVAATLGITVAAMKSRLHRARKQLRTQLDGVFGSAVVLERKQR